MDHEQERRLVYETLVGLTEKPNEYSTTYFSAASVFQEIRARLQGREMTDGRYREGFKEEDHLPRKTAIPGILESLAVQGLAVRATARLGNNGSIMLYRAS